MATIHGTNGNDTVYEGRYDDESIYTYGGNDTVVLHINDDYAGVVLVDTGEGDDTVQQSFNGNGTFYLGAGNDTFYSEGDGWWGESNYVYAGIGNDTFIVDTQHSYYWGEAGDDAYYSTGWSNGFDGGEGIDFVSYELASEAMTIDLGQGYAARGSRQETILNTENARGTSFNDILYGSSVANILEGGAGHDGLDGREGNDTLFGGAGNDLLYGGAGHDTLYGGTEDDTLYGEDGADHLWGGEGHDILHAGGGPSNMLYGEAGNDTLNGGSGIDYMHGGTGRDTLRGGAEMDYLHGDAEADTLYGDAGADSLNGGDGADFLYGGSENDSLLGETGNDTMRGDAGADRLSGGAGADILWGGADADTFVYNAISDSGLTATTRDTISDFVRGQDRIDLRTIDGNGAGAGNGVFHFQASYTGSASNASSYFTGEAGEIVIARSASQTVALFDVDGNDVADFSIAFTGNLALSAGDFIM